MGQGFKNMTSGKTRRREGIFVFTAGILLSLNSGYINGCCMSGLLSHLPETSSRIQPVSAFTGTYTKSALELSDGDLSQFRFHLSMIFSFVAGAFVSGFLNPKAIPYELRPSYGPTFLVGCIFMICASLFALFDPTGSTLYFFAAAANGVQNGMTSMYTANLIRTTHLTGTSTDIGLILGQIARGRFDNAWKFGVLCSLASSFWFGGILAFYSAKELDHLALAFSAILFLIIGLSHMLYIMITEHVTFWQATMGTWSWEHVLQELKIVDKEGTTLSEEEILEVFDKLDKDKSGTLDAEELYDGMKSLNITVPKVRVASMVTLVDENGDGVIDRKEFLALVWLMHNRANRRIRMNRRSSFSSLRSIGSTENLQGYLTRKNSVDCEDESNLVGKKIRLDGYDARMSLLTPRTLNADGTRKTVNSPVDEFLADGSDYSSDGELESKKRSARISRTALKPIIDDVEADGDSHLEENLGSGSSKVVDKAPGRRVSDSLSDERDDDEGMAMKLMDSREYNFSPIGESNSFTSCHSSNQNKQSDHHDSLHWPDAVAQSGSNLEQEESKEENLPSTYDGALCAMNGISGDEDCRALVVTEPASPFRVVRVNKAWEDLCGYTQEEAQGRTMRELVQGPATDRRAVQSAMSRLVRRQEKRVEFTTTNYRKDRTTFQNRITVGPLIDEENGVTTHFVAILRDLAAMSMELEKEKII